VVAEADLSVSKTDDPDPVVAGTQLTYSVTLENFGPSEAQSVVATDTLPAGVTFVSTSGCDNDPSGLPTCDLGTIAPGTSRSYTVTVVVDPDRQGVHTNTVAVDSDTTDPDPSNNSASEDTTVVAEADLSVTKSDSPDPVVAGTNLVYNLTVANAGPSDAQAVVATDILPAGLTLVSSTGCAEDPSGVPTCSLATIAAGGSKDVTLTVAVGSQLLGAISNSVSVSSDAGDPDPGNNSATEDTLVVSEADLGVEKVDSQDPVAPGGALSYTISAINNGPSDALNVVATDTLPAGIAFVSTTGCAEDPNGVPTCSLGTVAGGASSSYTVDVTVGAGTPTSILTNAVTVTSDTPDTFPGNNSTTEETQVDAEPPRVTLVDSQAGTGDGELAECEEARSAITRVLVVFDEEVRDPPGDGDPDDVTNPSNYWLLVSGPDRDISTGDCSGLAGDDVVVPVDAVSYDPGSSTATLTVNGGVALGDALHRLLVCGSTSIRDLAGNALDGNGDGVEGDDFLRTFRVERRNLFVNGQFDCDIDTWVAVSTLPGELSHSSEDVDDSLLSGSALTTNLSASTDFALGQCANGVLPTLAYSFAGQMRLDAAPGELLTVTRTCEFFSLADCAGTSLGLTSGVAFFTDTGGAWEPLESSLLAPDGAASALCSYDLRIPTGGSFDAYLDELTLSTADLAPIFSDGFESGDTTAWSGTLP
jgi:uncharacterized repeat protein (TIGR01451 family)